MPRIIDVAARKEELAHALWQVILTQGMSAVSVRTVAAEAGLAVSSLRHVFPTRTDLLLFSAELMFRQVTDRIQHLPLHGQPEDKALQVASEVVPFTAQTRAEMEVHLALISESRALPELRKVRDNAAADLQEICRILVLTLHGVDQIPFGDGAARVSLSQEQAATRLHVVLDGLALNLVMRSEGEDTSWAREILRQEIESITH